MPQWSTLCNIDGEKSALDQTPTALMEGEGSCRSDGSVRECPAMSRLRSWPNRHRLTFAVCVSLMAPALIGGVSNPRRESPPAGISDRAVAAGDRAPEVKLDSTSGGPWSLARALEGGPVVLVFYRGDW